MRGASAGRWARAGVHRVRRAAGADGAEDSGLSALLGASALSSAGDALVAVALAGTVFFAVPLGEARDRVALYLLLTLLPFSLLVPVAGPVLDRFRHGRRNVLFAATAGRGLLTWSMAGLTASLGLYPLALAVLVLSRSYGVVRSAALPRVRPPDLDPVTANARVNVAVVASSAVAAAVGSGVQALLGPGWVLRLATVVLLVAAVCAVRLPEQVDEARAAGAGARTLLRYRLFRAPAAVQRPLVTALALRALAGLLTVFLAFLLKGTGAPFLLVAVVVGAAVGGQLVGTGLASRLPARVTARLGSAALVLPVVACAAAAVRGGTVLAGLAAGTAGLSYALSKFALDAALQAHVPVRCSGTAFARSETGLQLAWAVGGGLGLVLPAVPVVGFGAAAVLPVLGIAAAARVARGLPVLARRRGETDRDGSACAAPEPPSTAAGPATPRPAGSSEARGGGGAGRAAPASPVPEPPPHRPGDERPWWLEDGR